MTFWRKPTGAGHGLSVAGTVARAVSGYEKPCGLTAYGLSGDGQLQCGARRRGAGDRVARPYYSRPAALRQPERARPRLLSVALPSIIRYTSGGESLQCLTNVASLAMVAEKRYEVS